MKFIKQSTIECNLCVYVLLYINC